MTTTCGMKLNLTLHEAELWSHAGQEPDRYEETRVACEAAQLLMLSLLEREALPDIRVRYLTDPTLNIGVRMSRLDVFRRNGCRTSESIFEHPHFLRHLRYLVEGPQLPPHVIEEFATIVEEDPMTCDLLDRLREASRRAVRQWNLREHADDFFMLALELGVDEGIARSVRDAVTGMPRRR